MLEKIARGYADAKAQPDRRSPHYAPVSSPRSARPDFLCIGAQKAGTTWLYANLRSHPAILMPPVKEVAYFSTLYIPGWAKADADHRAFQVAQAREHWNSPERADPKRTRPEIRERVLASLDALAREPMDDSAYATLFKAAAVDQVCGEISPQYCVLPREGIRHALSFNPNLKVIALLRHPVARAMSHLAMLCGKNPTAERMKEIALSNWWNGVSWYSDYATWLLRWKGMLPAEQLHIDYNGLIRDDPMGVLRRICDFLGLPFSDQQFPKSRERVFEGGKPVGDTTEVRAIVTERLGPLLADLRERMPDVAAALDRYG
ncbi:sulfotransferase [Roseomonas eburnea]|uniref:Sulfotransferase n=1 Tax=Neoroseomonas eburnea TaxID=1346889 RepID=A0A9X9XJB6_9PROT|nr:sulfotransferase [Neoroseomonas eburnea]MBR0683802.1 sulfotransferase [Neoroseomonas eburnea]